MDRLDGVYAEDQVLEGDVAAFHGCVLDVLEDAIDLDGDGVVLAVAESGGDIKPAIGVHVLLNGGAGDGILDAGIEENEEVVVFDAVKGGIERQVGIRAGGGAARE